MRLLTAGWLMWRSAANSASVRPCQNASKTRSPSLSDKASKASQTALRTGSASAVAATTWRKVIGDEEHLQFFVHHLGALAAQDLHAHGGFNIAEPQFDLPAPGVKLGDVLGGILLWVQQRTYKCQSSLFTQASRFSRSRRRIGKTVENFKNVV